MMTDSIETTAPAAASTWQRLRARFRAMTKRRPMQGALDSPPEHAKLSDLALDRAIDQSYQTARRAIARKRLARSVCWALALSIAVVGPLLNLPESAEPTPQLLQGPKGDKGDPGTASGGGFTFVVNEAERPAGTDAAKIEVLSEIRILSAPPNKLWHRAVFEQLGDEFRALPDARFSLSLQNNPTRCGSTSCSAIMAARFTGFAQPTAPAGSASASAQLQIDGRKIRQSGLSSVCRLVDQPTPILVCSLRSARSTRAADDVCLWLRRSDRWEANNERVALDIRWEKTELGDGASCPAP